jgi:steroid 5-alpha reductase family enzyme
MTIKASKTIINLGLLVSLSLSAILLFTDFNIINIGKENYQLSNRLLFFLALFIFQMRFFFLINYIKKNSTTHQVTSRLKNPYLADALTGIFLFCILPLVLTFLNIYFNHSLNYWYLIFFLLYIFGTSITLISENQRRKWKLENSAKSKLYTDGLFKYARYINYFGEAISQPALWFIATGVWWVSLIALLYELYDFSFVHIPKQDKYLLKKYGDDFKEISIHRKKLIPFIY